MRLFKRNKKDKVSPVQDKVAKGIAGFLLSIQARFASFMNTLTNQLSARAKRFWLAIFCLVFGGFSIYAFIGAFRSDEHPSRSVKPAQLSVPKYYDQKEINNDPVVTESDMMRIGSFKKYMDSLQRSVKGKVIHDSILKARPGLMDSIQLIEQLYYSQSK